MTADMIFLRRFLFLSCLFLDLSFTHTVRDDAYRIDEKSRYVAAQSRFAQESTTRQDDDLSSALRFDDIVDDYNIYRLEHPHTPELLQYIRECHLDRAACEETSHLHKIYSLAAKISNQHSALLISDQAKSLFQDIFYYLDPFNLPKSSRLSSKLCHILYLTSFSLGEIKQVGGPSNFH